MSTIVSNYHLRDFLYDYEVPKKVVEEEYNHLSSEDIGDYWLRYKGIYYHLSDFILNYDVRDYWQGYVSTCGGCAITIHVEDDNEHYTIGRELL